MTATGQDRPQGPRATGLQDTATVFATWSGKVIFGLAIQSLLAYVLLPEGRGSFAVCVVFAAALSTLFTPGSRQGHTVFRCCKARKRLGRFLRRPGHLPCRWPPRGRPGATVRQQQNDFLSAGRQTDLLPGPRPGSDHGLLERPGVSTRRTPALRPPRGVRPAAARHERPGATGSRLGREA